MGNYNRDDRGSRGGYRGRDSGRPEMHRATCSDCGKSCEVPFKPTGSKPVFCDDCFGGKNKSDSRDRGGRDSGRGRDSRGRDKEMFRTVCDGCGKSCEVPFKPTSGKSVYCSPCFGKGGGSGHGSDHGSGQSDKNHEEINAKLDKILRILGPDLSLDPPVKKNAAKKTKAAKAKKEVKPKKKAKAKAKPKAKKKVAAKKTTAKKKK